MENITYEGLPQGQKVKLTLLDEGTENCLKGSTWVFPNNGNGSYTIAQNEPGCTPGERNIVWSYQLENGQTILQYKRLPGGVKAKDITDGYKFNIVSATDATPVRYVPTFLLREIPSLSTIHFLGNNNQICVK